MRRVGPPDATDWMICWRRIRDVDTTRSDLRHGTIESGRSRPDQRWGTTTCRNSFGAAEDG